MLKKLLTVIALCAATIATAAVDVNKANEAELDAVKGVGPGTSKQIIAERKKSEFKNWDDLKSRIKGIGEAKAARLSAQGLTVGGESYKNMSATAVAPAKERKESAKPMGEGSKGSAKDADKK